MNNKNIGSIEIFFSYAHEDEDLKITLEKHLSILKRLGYLKPWHDRKILPGEKWKSIIDKHIHTAQIILLLISADFINSDFCYGAEMSIALKRHTKGEAITIPVILRPIDNWQATPFGMLLGLPRDRRPITKWKNQDEAFAEVAKGIREVVESLLLSTDNSPKLETTVKGASFILGSNLFLLNGEEQVMDVAPYIKNGIMYLPVRYVALGLGVAYENILWKEDVKKITIIKDDKVVQLTIGNNIILVNGVSIAMDVAPEYILKNVMLPPRIIAKVFGATVSWDEETQAISLFIMKKND